MKFSLLSTTSRWLKPAGLAAALLLTGWSGAQAQTTTSLAYTGASQTFTVPANVTSLQVDMTGAQGGGGTSGGRGGRVQATLTVVPGQLLTVIVGGSGGSGMTTDAGYATGGSGGFSSYGLGAGGGGATVVLTGGTSLSNRVLVAGGGGGNGGDADVSGGIGGAGGGLLGQNASVGGGNSNTAAGDGGSQAAAGSGGSNDIGGNGGDSGDGGGGGGGGGGYYGGGGGGGGGAGTFPCLCGADSGGGGGGGSSYAGTGTSAVTHTQGYQSGDGYVTFTYTAPVTYPDLVISTSGQSIPAGTYNSITVQSGGTGTLTGNVTVNTNTTVNSGGTLNDGCFVLNGAGSFALAAGGTLGICSAQGLSSSGATGAIQNTGARSYSTDASYVYTGTAAQSTGSGLPATVRSLATTNNNALTLNQPTSIAQTLTLGGGNLALNGQVLTLLSSASGTALVVNTGTGVVSGGTATVQRYLTTNNPGLGYRHYSSPVGGNTLSDLATGSFAPVFNSAYNPSLTPGLVRPFPTVIGYDQSRLSMAITSYGPFDKGWYSPCSGSNNTPDAFIVGRGYAANLRGTELVDFTGTLNTGTYALTLARNAGATAADAGWQLVGNPYPAPLDWSAVAATDRTGLDASMYVFESSAQYAGSYRSYVNGIGSPLIGSGQGFFVRVSSGQTSGSLTFRNAQRKTSFADQVAVRRGTADARPQLQLTLAGNGLSDALVVYAEAGATSGLDAAFDAAKLPNPSGLNLASLTAASDELAIDGRPDFTTATRIPLFVGVPAAGAYTLTAAALANLAGTRLTLVDNLTGTRTPLAAGTAYAFTLTGFTAPGRFWLDLAPAGALASAPAATAAQVMLYPNPASQGQTVTVALPVPAGSGAVAASLFNSLGQVVATASLPVQAGHATGAVPTAGLAAGVYTLRLRVEGTVLTKRFVVN